jgi:microcin C transport system permease protein
MATSQISESITQKRIKRFKSMKRGYYSLIMLITLYFISLLGPLWQENNTRHYA